MKGKLNEVVKQFLIQSNKQFFRSKFMDNSDIEIGLTLTCLFAKSGEYLIILIAKPRLDLPLKT